MCSKNIDNIKSQSLNSLINLQLKKSELERYEADVSKIELDNYIKSFTKFEVKDLKKSMMDIHK